MNKVGLIIEGLNKVNEAGVHDFKKSTIKDVVAGRVKVADYIRGQNSEKEQIWNVNMDSEYHEIKKQNK